MSRRCRMCRAIHRKKVQAEANHRYQERRKRLRSCIGCGADISDRYPGAQICESCASEKSFVTGQMGGQVNAKLFKAKEAQTCHAINPERWPPEVLAERQNVPVEVVEQWLKEGAA